MLCLLCLTALTCLSRQLSIPTNLLRFFPVCPSPLWVLSPAFSAELQRFYAALYNLSPPKKLEWFYLDCPLFFSVITPTLFPPLSLSLLTAVIFIPLSSGSENRSSSRPISISRGPRSSSRMERQTWKSNRPAGHPSWHHGLSDTGFRRALAMLMYWYMVVTAQIFVWWLLRVFWSIAMHFSPAYPVTRRYLEGQVSTSKVVKEPDASSQDGHTELKF